MTSPLLSTSKLLRVAKSMARQSSLSGVVRAVSEEISDVIPHHHIDIALMTGDKYLLIYEAGLRTLWSGRPESVATSPIRDLFLGRTDQFITNDAISDERFHFFGVHSAPIFDSQLRSRIHRQLKVADSIIGALSVSSTETSVYRKRHLIAAGHIADLLAPYVYALQQSELLRRSQVERDEAFARAERMRDGAQSLTEELERERRRIGLDLHDQVLADLSRIQRSLGDDDLSSDRVRDLRASISQCVHELRAIIDHAKPTILEMFGLPDAIQAHLEKSIAMSGQPISCSVQDRSNGHFDGFAEALKVSIYRIAQEAINNSIRHAGCDKIDVELNRTHEAATLAVSDNGPGIGAPFAAALRTMRMRASLIGASIDFVHASAATRLQLKIPTVTP